jgi:type II secretory pathway pseudopilin PulG
MGPVQYFKQPILALGTPISLLFTLTSIPLLLPVTIPLIFLALIILLVLVLLALLLVLLVVLFMLLAHLPRLLQSQPSARENLATRHVRNNTSSSNANSIMFSRKGSIDTQRQRVAGDGFRNRLGSCHEHEYEHETDMDVGNGHGNGHGNGNGLSASCYPTSGFLSVNGPQSTATFGIDSPRKKRFA